LNNIWNQSSFHFLQRAMEGGRRRNQTPGGDVAGYLNYSGLSPTTGGDWGSGERHLHATTAFAALFSPPPVSHQFSAARPATYSDRLRAIDSDKRGPFFFRHLGRGIGSVLVVVVGSRARTAYRKYRRRRAINCQPADVVRPLSFFKGPM